MTLPMLSTKGEKHPRRAMNDLELRLIGKVLQHARLRAKLSPTMLGMLANVNITHIIAMEAGRRDIATTTLMRLCQAMGITMKQFWTIEEPSTPPASDGKKGEGPCPPKEI